MTMAVSTPRCRGLDSALREDRPGKPAVTPTRKEALLESEASLGCIVKPVSENKTGAGEMTQ